MKLQRRDVALVGLTVLACVFAAGPVLWGLLTSLKIPTQVVLASIHEEILAITRLPMAIQFLTTELKHSGVLASGFARLPHYFKPFQTLHGCCHEHWPGY